MIDIIFCKVRHTLLSSPSVSLPRCPCPCPVPGLLLRVRSSMAGWQHVHAHVHSTDPETVPARAGPVSRRITASEQSHLNLGQSRAYHAPPGRYSGQRGAAAAPYLGIFKSYAHEYDRT